LSAEVDKDGLATMGIDGEARTAAAVTAARDGWPSVGDRGDTCVDPLR